jgi:hypothetical protein
MHAFNSHGYYCAVHRYEFISLPLQHISSGTSPEYLLADLPFFFNDDGQGSQVAPGAT